MNASVLIDIVVRRATAADKDLILFMNMCCDVDNNLIACFERLNCSKIRSI